MREFSKVVIVDLDGTLTNSDHRTHLVLESRPDWREFERRAAKDPPHDDMVTITRAMFAAGLGVVLCSGRSEHAREITEDWCRQEDVPYDLMMLRKIDDHRPDDIVKLEMLEDIQNNGYDVLVVFDDRDSVVQMWRSTGVRCFQVAPGQF